jgi:hypothetical protein
MPARQTRDFRKLRVADLTLHLHLQLFIVLRLRATRVESIETSRFLFFVRIGVSGGVGGIVEIVGKAELAVEGCARWRTTEEVVAFEAAVGGARAFVLV